MIWDRQLFNHKVLLSTDYEYIQVLSRGTLNTNDGPDFLEAKIKVGNTVLVGSVECHLKTSDWLKHKHHLNNRYNNVILHVVWNNDSDITSLNCPTLELKGKVSKYYLDNYVQLLHDSDVLPCSFALSEIEQSWLHLYRKELFEARFYNKIDSIVNEFSKVKIDRIYQVFLAVLGKPKNEYGFIKLAHILPYHILQKSKGDKHKLEALLFGVSGLLENAKNVDRYIVSLKKTYQYLKQLYKLDSMSVNDWVFLRIRPMAFPTIHLALLADLFSKVVSLENFVLESSHHEITTQLTNLEVSEFWKHHFVYDKKSKCIAKHFGKATVLKLWINAVVPLQMMYSKSKNSVLEKAFTFLCNQPSESNSIVKLMSRNGFDNKNAFQSQFNLHKYKYYCIPRKCLNCGVGLKIIRNHDQ